MVTKIYLSLLMFLQIRVIMWGIEYVVQGVSEGSWKITVGGILLSLGTFIMLCDVLQMLLSKAESAE